jgi:FdhD protein
VSDLASRAPSDPAQTVEVAVHRFESGAWQSIDDEVATEEPLEIRLDGDSLAVIMRTPGEDPFLGIGFLLAERVIQSIDDVEEWWVGRDQDGYPDANALDIRLRPGSAGGGGPRRQFVVSSSCGRCGTATIAAAMAQSEPIGLDLPSQTIEVAALLSLDAKLRAEQAVFSRTGGLHAAGLFDIFGNLLAIHEDVGRHNAVDKVVGEQAIARKLPLNGAVLLVSGRASFELVQKATVAGIPILAAVGAPSSLAVEMARASQLTLVGMLRNRRFVVYSYPERIVGGVQ